jgi:methylmalonyl-CoA mutase cobalamin-binding domain/chain
VSKEETLRQLKEAIILGNREMGKAAARKAMDIGVSPMHILISGCCEGLKVLGIIGEKYRSRKYNMLDVLLAINVMEAIVEVIKPPVKIGRVVIGSVENDPHDIGKDFVALMLEAIGFEVYNLGLGVPPEKFINKAQEVDADLIAASAATYTATMDQKKLSEMLKNIGIRSKIKYLVGGFSCTPEWARQIEADGYGEDALEALKVAEELLKKMKEERKMGIGIRTMETMVYESVRGMEAPKNII